MFELICLINPRSPKLEDFFGNRETLQGAKSNVVMKRICFDGFLRPAGWTRLPTIRRITDLLKSSSRISEIEFAPIYYAHPFSNISIPKITEAIDDIVDREGKPTVACINGCQAVTLTKEENGFYVFKNSYGTNNRNNPPWINIPTSLQPGLTRNDFKLFTILLGRYANLKLVSSQVQGQNVVFERFVGLTIGAKLKCGIYIVS